MSPDSSGRGPLSATGCMDVWSGALGRSLVNKLSPTAASESSLDIAYFNVYVLKRVVRVGAGLKYKRTSHGIRDTITRRCSECSPLFDKFFSL